MKYNGLWSNDKDRIAIFRTVEDIIIHYRKVDKKGNKLSGIHKELADEVLTEYTKEGSGISYEEFCDLHKEG